MDRSFIILLIASTVLLASLGGVAWYKNQMNVPVEITAQAEIDESCDINLQACSLSISNVGQVTFSITPTPIPLVSDLSLLVKTNLKGIKQVMVDFKGMDMEMGPNQIILKKNANGDFFGKGMLPVCIRYSMHWKASIYVETSDGLYVAPYVFETHK
ncbi:MAG: hypothetical protein QM504_10360 [Pseudomonadota bacterium]